MKLSNQEKMHLILKNFTSIFQSARCLKLYKLSRIMEDPLLSPLIIHESEKIRKKLFRKTSNVACGNLYIK